MSPMSLPVRSLVPLLSVKSVRASIGFYERLGFRVANTLVPEGASDPVWASLQGAGCEVMVGQAEERTNPDHQAVMFYLYVEDVAAKHAELAAAGLAVGQIEHPFWSPRGEFGLKDPDGYDLTIAHT